MNLDNRDLCRAWRGRDAAADVVASLRDELLRTEVLLARVVGALEGAALAKAMAVERWVGREIWTAVQKWEADFETRPAGRAFWDVQTELLFTRLETEERVEWMRGELAGLEANWARRMREARDDGERRALADRKAILGILISFSELELRELAEAETATKAQNSTTENTEKAKTGICIWCHGPGCWVCSGSGRLAF